MRLPCINTQVYMKDVFSRCLAALLILSLLIPLATPVLQVWAAPAYTIYSATALDSSVAMLSLPTLTGAPYAAPQTAANWVGQSIYVGPPAPYPGPIPTQAGREYGLFVQAFDSNSIDLKDQNGNTALHCYMVGKSKCWQHAYISDGQDYSITAVFSREHGLVAVVDLSTANGNALYHGLFSDALSPIAVQPGHLYRLYFSYYYENHGALGNLVNVGIIDLDTDQRLAGNYATGNPEGSAEDVFLAQETTQVAIRKTGKWYSVPESAVTVTLLDLGPAVYLAPQRTAAQHDACLANQNQAFVADPVNTRTGNFTLPATDFALPTRGLPLTFVRTYNAMDTADGPLGRGWTHEYQTRLLAVSGGLILVTPEGSRLPFTLHRNGSYVPGPGVRATLIKQADGRFMLTRGDGIVYTFDTSANNYRLLAQTDPQGHVTTLTYTNNRLTQITAPDGRVLTLTYVSGRISRVTDPAGRSVNYTYTTLSGVTYLTAVRDRSGATWTYTYTAGLMTAFSNPIGATVTNVYDTRGRVIAQYDPLQQPTTFDYAYERTLVTDAANNTTTYSYNAAGALIAVTDALGHTTSYTYDDNLNVATVTDPLGRTTEFTWNDSACSFSSIKDAMGHTTTLSYDARNNLLAITDPLGRSTHFGYTVGDALAAITNTMGAVATFTYDAYGQMTSSTNARGDTTATAYDLYGNLTVITDALGHATHLSYDLAGRPTVITDANGHTTTFLYDADDNLLAVTNPLSGTTTFAYDLAGNLTAVTDANGHTQALAYDAAGRLITLTDALQGQTVFAYDAAGRVIRVTDANGRATHFSYDGAGRLVTITDALNGQTRYVYDAAGNVISVTDPTNATTTFQYDALNRTVAITDALGHAAWFGYNAVGNVVAALDPTGVLIQYTYDALDRPLSVTTPGVGQVAAYAYDPAGNLISVTDANAHTTRYVYDALNRLAQVIDPLSHVTTYGYDPVGNLIDVTDANAHTRTYVYDALNQLVAASDPLGHITAYGYDAVGNTTVITDADGLMTHYAYDNLNRLSAVQYPAALQLPAFSVQYSYDAVGNRVAMTDPTGVTTYGYDNLYRPTSITAPYAGTVSYRYDAAGRRTQTLYPGGDVITYTYNAAGWLEQVVDWDGNSTLYSYDNAGRIRSMTRPNAVRTNYGYDVDGRLTELAHTRSADTLAQYAYTLDNAGNRIQVVESITPPVPTPMPTPPPDDPCYCPPRQMCPDVECPTPLGTQTLSMAQTGRSGNTYTYDALDRLVAADYAAGSDYTYTYDNVGNRTADEIFNNYTYDAADRLTRVSYWTYTYDNRGNLLQDDTWNYSYDGAGRMVQAESHNLIDPISVEYMYNGDGLLVAESVNGAVKRFTWDQALELPQLLATSDGTRYLYGLELAGVHTAGQWYYPHTDALGSIRRWSDASGSSVGELTYDPYGSIIQQQGSIPAPFGFAGEWRDPTTGLQYLRARWYNPATGRFTQVDPFPGVLSLPGTQHPYAYALDNPLRYTDPSGEIVIEAVVGAAVVGALIGGAAGGIGYAVQNPGQSLGQYVKDAEFRRAVGVGAASGAVSGLMGLLSAGSFWGAVGLGALSGALVSGVGQITSNLLTPCTPWHQNLGRALITGAISGAITGGVGFGIRQWWAARATSKPQPMPNGVVYRGGSRTSTNLTPRPGIDLTGLSTFDNLEAAVEPGGKAQVIDISRLKPPLQAIPDAPPPGHVSITPLDSALIKEWAATRGADTIHPLTQAILDAVIETVRRPK